MGYFLGYIFILFLSFRRSKYLDLKYLFIFIFLVLFIGLRHEVGADWFQYLTHLITDPFHYLRNSPGYFLMTYFVNEQNLGIYGLNTIGAAIFSFGLIYFCRSLRNPSIALISAYPYFIVVVAMGFLRQSCALGFVLIGLTFYKKKNFLGFFLMIGIAVIFHDTAIVLLAIPILNGLIKIREKRVLIILSLLSFPIAYLISIYFPIYYVEYRYFFKAEYAALGAGLKILIPFAFSFVFLWKKKMFAFNDQENSLYLAMYACLFILLVYTFLTVTTAGAYRLSLYFYPIIFAVSSGLPDSKILNISKRNWQLFMISYNFFILFIWVNFSYHSLHWLPYKNLLLL